MSARLPSAHPGACSTVAADIFAVPVSHRVLIHAPLHGISALVSESARDDLRRAFSDGEPPEGALGVLAGRLNAACADALRPRSGTLDPLFLGLIPTRGCNLGCHYCDFAAPKQSSAVMSVEVARQAVDAYLRILEKSGTKNGQIHFFGGEPFHAEKLVRWVTGYTSEKAAQSGIKMRFEATSNGAYSETLARWIAATFDTVVLSLDGPADVQNAHRPALNGRGSAGVVERTARIFSEGPVELILRCCITQATAARMPEMAEWMAREFRPSRICFESLTRSPRSQEAGLGAPDPEEFARGFDAAATVLREHGIKAVVSTADLSGSRIHFCPAGQDALIVSPDGTAAGCYLLPEDWARRGVDMRFAKVTDAGFDVDADALEQVRAFTVENKPRCANCFCRYSCAGGCHIHHPCDAPADAFDEVCVQTRLITAAGLLRRLRQEEWLGHWFADSEAVRATAQHRHDRLLHPTPISTPNLNPPSLPS